MSAAAPDPAAGPPSSPVPAVPARPSVPLTLRQRRRLQPPRLAQAIVGLAVSNLPPHLRDRYSCEFFAEMWGMPRSREVAYALAILRHSWQLASALAEPDEAARAAMRPHRPWACRLGRHKYVRRYARMPGSPSTYYHECVSCGRFRDVPYLPLGAG